MVGYNDGSKWATDEYGYHPGEPGYQNEKLRDKEWETARLAKEEWAKKRLGRSVAHVDKFNHDGVHDKIMGNYLRREGLLPMSVEQK